MNKSLISVITAALTATAVSGEVILPDIVGNNMVLQQESDALVWGWCSPGKSVTIESSWDKSPVTATADSDGRWTVRLHTPEASMNPQKLRISGDGSDITLADILIGEVWLCSGQSNMEMPIMGFWTQPVEGAAEAIASAGRYPSIRVAKVPKSVAEVPQSRVVSPWRVSNPRNAREFSALAYFFARELTDLLSVPIGIIDCSYGGTKLESWMNADRLAQYHDIDLEKEKNDSTFNLWYRANLMYNAMLHPLKGYTVKGFLWNQGESNVGQDNIYAQRQRDFVKDLRHEWDDDNLPFLFVELPGWNYSDPEGDSAARFRECQHKAASITPNSAIVCTSDLVYPYEIEDIHARKKREIGQRLAWLAGEKAYGIDGLPTEYPQFSSMNVEADKAVLTFKNAPCGLSPHVSLEGFEVAGKDRIFYPAVAVENPQTLEIEVMKPEDVDRIEAVRYNFKNFAIGKVHNTFGLPLIPFRTDNW